MRENGGQYTHAATWVVLAFARSGRGRAAFELFNLLNPIRHADGPDAVDVVDAARDEMEIPADETDEG